VNDVVIFFCATDREGVDLTDEHKKAHLLSQMSLKYIERRTVLNQTLLWLIFSRVNEIGFGTFISTSDDMGCQGFIGPIPSAFLDKLLFKELVQMYKQLGQITKFCFKKNN